MWTLSFLYLQGLWFLDNAAGIVVPSPPDVQRRDVKVSFHIGTAPSEKPRYFAPRRSFHGIVRHFVEMLSKSFVKLRF